MRGECWMITPEIETERLILREVHKEDVDDIFNCWMQDESKACFSKCIAQTWF